MCNPSEILTALRGSDELKLRIIRDIGRFTVALFAAFDSEKGGRLELAGTGTLLTVGGSHYILTAAHVWEEVLKSAAKVGITLTEDINHGFFMDASTIVPCGPPKPATWNEWGPDIAFLRIPSEYLGSIKAHRDYFNPTVGGRTARTVNNAEVRLLMSTPAAFGIFAQNQADVQVGGCFVNHATRCEIRCDFDYFDFEVDASFPDTPESYGGVSGGGLWTVLIHCSCSTGEVDWDQTLEGVAFYQLPIEKGRRAIRCHGPKSILAAMPSRWQAKDPAR